MPLKQFVVLAQRVKKSIYLILTVCLLSITGCQTAAPNETGFRSLFDGQSLKGWTMINPKGGGFAVTNLVEEGVTSPVIYCPKGGGGALFYEKEYADFILRFQFKLTWGANNGLAIRTPMQGKALAYEGMELQILDNTNAEERYGRELKPVQFHGALYNVAAPSVLNAHRPVGEWNDQEVAVIGRRVTVRLNGRVIQDVDLNDIRDPTILLKHPGLLRESGHIGFLGHNDEVYFRNIRIKSVAKVQLNNKHPEGFEPLFDGATLVNWQGLLAKPNNDPTKRAALSANVRLLQQSAANQRMLAHWRVVDGELRFDGKGDSLSTVREDYANYELWLDWKIGPKGDSGVYLRGQPQVQIWDPRGDDNPVAASGSGALFNNKKALNEPLVKADRITGDWNRFRILMIEDRVHVYLNGQLVVKNTPLENYWQEGEPLPEQGPIELQAHGSPLAFRNIYLREIK